MPRELSVPSRLYEPGFYSFDINGFVKDDTEHALLSLTVENWPAAEPIITGWFGWDIGGGQDIWIRSPVLDRFRQPVSVWSLPIFIQRNRHGKLAVKGAHVTLTSVLPLRTAISLRAVPVEKANGKPVR